MSIKRVLIANRGEIAARIIKTCKRLGIETVLVASKPDLDTLPAKMADRTLCIGPARATDSYLKVGAIIQAALGSGADAIHPGYGFLSENQSLGKACVEEGIKFIGPTPEQLDSVGDKLKARHCAMAANVPITPGDSISTVDEALELAESIGYPVLIKAVSGGGGKGMKRVNHESEMEQAVSMAISEAQASFGDPRVYLELYVTKGRHVEVQVLGDGERVIHLGDRDCSVQRRFQKVIEEAPAPELPDEIRQIMRESAVRFSESINYEGLGTVEFLYDCERNQAYFLEMNARIQVEHPVTEMVVNMDLVEEQIKVASGESLQYRQEDIEIKGHSFECRINAEDPSNDFLPSPGRLTQVAFPEGSGIRVDTHIETGSMITPFYDSMIGKLIVHGNTRKEALMKMRETLDQCHIEGVKTNIALHKVIFDNADFQKGGFDTGFLPNMLDQQNKTN